MLKLAQARRHQRAGEWTQAKAVTFIVTLAARRSVTLAAQRSGMSRKAAYALKHRNPAFAAAWNAAIAASMQGDKVDEADRPRISSSQGNKRRPSNLRPRTAPRPARLFEAVSGWASDSNLSLLARDFALP